MLANEVEQTKLEFTDTPQSRARPLPHKPAPTVQLCVGLTITVQVMPAASNTPSGTSSM